MIMDAAWPCNMQQRLLLASLPTTIYFNWSFFFFAWMFLSKKLTVTGVKKVNMRITEIGVGTEG